MIKKILLGLVLIILTILAFNWKESVVISYHENYFVITYGFFFMLICLITIVLSVVVFLVRYFKK